MKISVIVPVYNSEKTLYKLYNSIKDQSYQNYELILVDDNSNDNSYQLMEKIKKENNKVKIFTKENEGPGLTRKYGFEHSTGDLLYFVDSDDWLPDNEVFMNIINIFKKFNPDVLLFDREVITDNTKSIITPFSNQIKPGIHLISEITNCTIRGGLGLKIFRKDIIKSNFFKSGNNYEDFYTTYRYLDFCKNFYYINKDFYCINRFNDNHSLTKIQNIDKFNQALCNMIEAYELSNNLAIKKSISIIMIELYMRYFYSRVMHLYGNDELQKIKYNIKRLKTIVKSHKLFVKNFPIKKKIIYYFFLK